MASEYQQILKGELARQRSRLASLTVPDERDRLEKLISLLERQLGLGPSVIPTGAVVQAGSVTATQAAAQVAKQERADSATLNTAAERAFGSPPSVAANAPVVAKREPAPAPPAPAAPAPPPASAPAPPNSDAPPPVSKAPAPPPQPSVPAPTGIEARKMVRLPVATVVHLTRDDDTFDTIGRNVSATGIGVACERFLMPGGKASATVDSPFGPIFGQCIIRWCQRLALSAGYDFEVGLEFSEISPVDQERLRLWVSNLGG